MTEDEAKTKWCPFSRVPFPGGQSGNRGFDKHPLEKESHCIGSACMAWRWTKVSDETKEQMQALKYAPMHDFLGYCGLTGKP